MRGLAALEALLQRNPSRRVELELKEGRPGVTPDVARRARVRAVVDVRVAVGRARDRWTDGAPARVGVGLVVTEGHPKPERRMELEVVRATGAVLPRQGGRLLGQGEAVVHRVTGARRLRVEEDRRFVMARVFAVVPDRLEDLGACDGVVATVRPVDGGGSRAPGSGGHESNRD